MDNLTWGELLHYIRMRAKVVPTFLDEDVTVCNQLGEFSPVGDILESLDDDILEDGHPYLQLPELPA